MTVSHESVIVILPVGLPSTDVSYSPFGKSVLGNMTLPFSSVVPLATSLPSFFTTTSFPATGLPSSVTVTVMFSHTGAGVEVTFTSQESVTVMVPA